MVHARIDKPLGPPNICPRQSSLKVTESRALSFRISIETCVCLVTTPGISFRYDATTLPNMANGRMNGETWSIANLGPGFLRLATQAVMFLRRMMSSMLASTMRIFHGTQKYEPSTTNFIPYRPFGTGKAVMRLQRPIVADIGKPAATREKSTTMPFMSRVVYGSARGDHSRREMEFRPVVRKIVPTTQPTIVYRRCEGA